MGTCIVSIFQYISNKMQRYTVYLYLETAVHVLGGTSTHHQECIQLHLQHLVFVTPLLLSAAIVEELEPVCVYTQSTQVQKANRELYVHRSGLYFHTEVSCSSKHPFLHHAPHRVLAMTVLATNDITVPGVDILDFVRGAGV
jgi:hypothetical protein